MLISRTAVLFFPSNDSTKNETLYIPVQILLAATMVHIK